MSLHLAVLVLGDVVLVAACVLLVPALVLLMQVCAARSSARVRAGAAPGEVVPPFAVLMPAHDEAGGIAAAIATILPQLRDGDRLLVVADNCTDQTAAVAAAAGAEVVERHDDARRGKGWALDYGVRALEARPPALVIIVDADCAVAPSALHRLAAEADRSQRPVQALYLMRSPPGAGIKTRIAEFAWLLKNHVRPLGGARLGLPCPLMGTGMAFPWPLIQRAPLASGHLVEDMQLGLDLAARGKAPMFCADALVTSVFPSDAEGARAQRTRWEHGHLSMIASRAPRLLAASIRRRDLQLAAMVLDLCVPPLASLVLVASLLAVLAFSLLMLGDGVLALSAAMLVLGLVLLAVTLAWKAYGRHVVSAGDLLRAPAYVLGKLPIYARLLKKRQSEWVRTRRSGD